MKYLGRSLGAVVSWILVASSAQAAGYFSGQRGGHATARGGAFAAKADDLSAVMYNPAGLAGLGTTVIQAADRISYGTQSFTRAATTDFGTIGNPVVNFGTVTSSQLQPLDPLLGVGTNFGLAGWGFALAAYAPPGAAKASFPLDGGSRFMMVSREAMMLNYALSAAYRFTDSFGIGISLQTVVVPSLKYQLVINANTSPTQSMPVMGAKDMVSTIEVSDYFTPNATLGLWGRPVDFLELGLSAQVIPTSIVAKGTLNVEPLTPEDVLQLYKSDPVLGRVAPDPVELTLPLPLTARAGVRYVNKEGTRELFDVEFDVVYEGWSRVDKLQLKTNGLMVSYIVDDLPVEDINVEKHWRDTLGFSLGGDVNVIPDTLTLRAGGFYETAAAADTNTNVDFPTGAQFGGALGASVTFGPLEISAALEYRLQETIHVTEAEGRVLQQRPTAVNTAPRPVVNAGTYDYSLYGATLDLQYRF